MICLLITTTTNTLRECLLHFMKKKKMFLEVKFKFKGLFIITFDYQCYNVKMWCQK